MNTDTYKIVLAQYGGSPIRMAILEEQIDESITEERQAELMEDLTYDGPWHPSFFFPSSVADVKIEGEIVIGGDTHFLGSSFEIKES